MDDITYVRILHLEDDPADAELVELTLARDGIEARIDRVETSTEFSRCLYAEPYDLVLADHALPAFNGLEALTVVRRHDPLLPFILVSGTIGEEPAVEALTRGATDYVLKHRLPRLPPAVRRALAECEQRRERQRAEQRTQELLDQNRMLVRQLLDMQENERRHLARELHDEIGQSLTAIQTEATMMRRRAGAADAAETVHADAILELCGDIYDVVQAILERLRPAALDGLGLVEAMHDAANAWAARERGTRLSFASSGDIGGLGERVNIALYRAMQECLTNVAAHARARSVEICIAGPEAPRREPLQVRLVVRDDGHGMDLGGIGRGFGLLGMRERIEGVHGELQIESEPGRGTRVVVTVPVERSP